MKTQALAGAFGAMVLLAGCGGAAGGSTPPTASSLAAQLGCTHARSNSKLQASEMPRKDRTRCNGADIITFNDAASRDAYVKFVLGANKAFGQSEEAVIGDNWAVFASPAKAARIKDKVGGTVRKS